MSRASGTASSYGTQAKLQALIRSYDAQRQSKGGTKGAKKGAPKAKPRRLADLLAGFFRFYGFEWSLEASPGEG